MSDESTAPADEQGKPDESAAPDLESVETSQTEGHEAEQETPDYFGDTFDPATLHDDLRPGWKQLLGDYTRKTQEIAEERREIEEKAHYAQLIDMLRSNDPEENQVALKALDYDFYADPDVAADDLEDELYDEDYDEDDGLSAVQKKLAELEQWKADQESAFQESLQQQEAQQYEDAVNEFLDESWVELKKQIGRDDFSEEEELVLEQMAAANLDDDGLPDLGKAYTLLSDVLAANRGKWVKSKDAPEVSTAGSSATQVPDLDDPKQRREYMENRIAAIQASSAGHTGT
jgi:hypothetical protein